MRIRPWVRGLLLWACALSAAPIAAHGQSAAPVADRIAIVYTGRSLGALGVRRAQDEHELLTEQAGAEGVPFKLVSHLAWRAPGLVIFLPGTEPEGSELLWALANRGDAEYAEAVHALRSDNVLLFQDPWREEPDLLAMLGRNPRRRIDFPDLVPTEVRASRLRNPAGNRIIIIEEPGAVWTEDPAAWSAGEMNRVDLLDSRLYELPLNLGELGPRATLLRALRDGVAPSGGLVITADLGHQVADVGMPAADRALVDFTALRALGYSLSVPFEFELALGAAGLTVLRDALPEVTLLAANVTALDSTLFLRHRIIEHGDVRVGLIGLVNPTVRQRLPRAALLDFIFESPMDAARREVAQLRAAGVTAIIVLSNLDPSDHATLANEVPGVDVILADMPVQWAPETTRTRVDVPQRPYARPGAPLLVARTAANGIGVGRLDLEFRRNSFDTTVYLSAAEHVTQRVTDRTPPDTALVRAISEMATVTRRPRGELMVPAFVDLIERHPHLATYDGRPTQGRIPQRMWEDFMARVVRVRGNAEVSVIRRLEQFPPLIGKLHENEVEAWLWTEDDIVLVDMMGGDLRALLGSDTRNELVTSGIDLRGGSILGHSIADHVNYRVATTNVLFEGARAPFFSRTRRVRQTFRIDEEGVLVPDANGSPLALRDLILSELRRLRAQQRGNRQIDAIAAWLEPDPGFVRLLSIAFDRPNLFLSMNQVGGNERYGGVGESRISAANAWVIGSSGRLVVTQTRPHSATDYGLGLAYARQAVRIGGVEDVRETADDIRFDITLRPTGRRDGVRLLPFARGEFDSEFTPTEDPSTGLTNPRELAARAIGGLLVPPSPTWRRMEFALAVENDFGSRNLQYGVQSRTEYFRSVGRSARGLAAPAAYRFRNDLTYYFPSASDDATRLGLRYNMVHELLVPIVDELALAITADFFFFRGKVPATSALGSNAQLRLGLTYERLWKPRYQPFI